MRSLDAWISTKHSVNKSMWSREYVVLTTDKKKTLKMEINNLLHAMVVINKKKTNAFLKFNSSTYSVKNKLVDISRRIESEAEKRKCDE